MFILKTEEKEFKIKFGYEATLKTKILFDLAKFEKKDTEGLENVESLLVFLPKLLTIGLQKFHSDEYSFDYESRKGLEEQEQKIYSLIDDYLDFNEEEDVITLYNALINELLQNGFLKQQYQKEANKVKEKA